MRILVFVGGLATLAASAPAWAEASPHLRILLHGAKGVGESGLGVSGWLVAPNIASAPDTWLIVAGPRYGGEEWWVEVMGGAVVAGDNATPVIDVRAEYTGLDPFYTWANLEWIDVGFESTSQFYWYLQADYVLKIDNPLALIGIESENIHGQDSHALSVGPHLIVPIGDIVFQAAYQVHFDAADQLWFRTVLNF